MSILYSKTLVFLSLIWWQNEVVTSNLRGLILSWKVQVVKMFSANTNQTWAPKRGTNCSYEESSIEFTCILHKQNPILTTYKFQIHYASIILFHTFCSPTPLLPLHFPEPDNEHKLGGGDWYMHNTEPKFLLWTKYKRHGKTMVLSW